MKRSLSLTVVVILLVVSTAGAQQSKIGLYEDLAGTDCAMVDDVPTVKLIQVVHTMTAAASGADFAAPLPPCYGGFYLADIHRFGIFIGNSQNGVTVGYGGCFAAPINTMEIHIFNQGTTGLCCFWRITDNPNTVEPGAQAIDCAGNPEPAIEGQIVINEDPPGAGLFCDCGLPVDEATWGGIKALFVE